MIRLNSFLSFFAAALAISTFTTQAQPASKAGSSDNIVVMVSIDGLAGFYLDDPKAEMPNIRALAAKGARAESMKAVVPSVTWPNHTTLVTGVTPARHGVVGNNYLDRTTKEPVTLIQDPVFDKDQIVKVPTIYDVAKSNGLRTAAINWPASRNARTLDWTIPEVRSYDLLERYSTHSLMEECAKNGIKLVEDHPGATRTDRHEEGDDIYTQTFNLVLSKHRPQLALLHLPNVDHTEHEKGPRSAEAYAAIKVADQQVGEIWKELQRDYPGKATLFVVSDHGFSLTKRAILPNIILHDAGLVTIKGKKIVGGSVRVISQGGAAMVYVFDEKNRNAVLGRVSKAFEKVDGVQKIVGPAQLASYGVADAKKDRKAPDMIIFAKDGYSFGDTAAGQLPFIEKPERNGSHGHDPSLPNLHAMFVAWGVGIKPGARVGEIPNVDVAPTLAKVLHVSLPSPDGKALDEILTQ